MKTKAAESSSGVSVFKSAGRSEELPSSSASSSARSSKRKVETESGSAGIPSSVHSALDHIVGQLDMLTLVSMQQQGALAVLSKGSRILESRS